MDSKFSSMSASRSDLSWMARAACAGLSSMEWFPERGDLASIDAARAVCAACPVRLECLTHAMGPGSSDITGVWGGLCQRERKLLARARCVDCRGPVSRRRQVLAGAEGTPVRCSACYAAQVAADAFRRQHAAWKPKEISQ